MEKKWMTDSEANVEKKLDMIEAGNGAWKWNKNVKNKINQERIK